MPATFFILLHWKKQQRVFLQNLAKLTKQQETKAIHDLRVAIKKLRSYLKLLTILLNKINSGSGLEKTEQLFSILGKQRDIEMGLLLLQAFEKENKITYTAFRFHLKVALQRTEIWVKNALGKYDEKELAELTRQSGQYLKDTNKQELLDKTGIILNKELKKLKRVATHLPGQPHDVRKMLKNIFYWISICPKDFLMNSIQLRKIKKSLDLLGDWQDHEMLHRKIKHFRKDFVPASKEEYLLLKELEKNIIDKMEAMLHKADESIQGFIDG
jgi:CHAD domain-containing protein